MGLLIDGKWHDQWYDTASTGGRFKREESKFRNWITADGSAGPSGRGGFKAEPNRYHLYVSYACPWSHRTLIFRSLKGLEKLISLSVTHWHMGDHGWAFASDREGATDPVCGARYVYEIYQQADPGHNGRASVPVLWDKHQNCIVSNESSDIIRMFNSAFDGAGAVDGDYYPAKLRKEVDTLNRRIYETVNNGVYKAGFATTQQAYEEAVDPLFESLHWLDRLLADRRYLTGSTLTEADWRLFPTLVRFDPVYFVHFKCNKRRIVDYLNLWPYLCDLYQHPGIAETVRMDHIKPHYYVSHKTINPAGIVPVGPAMDFNQEQNRRRLAA